MAKAAPKRDRVYALFDRGFTTRSPEVKRIVPNAKSRSAYVSKWRKARGIKVDAVIGVAEAGPKTNLPGDESVAIIKEPPRTTEAASQDEPKGKQEQPEAKAEAREAEAKIEQPEVKTEAVVEPEVKTEEPEVRQEGPEIEPEDEFPPPGGNGDGEDKEEETGAVGKTGVGMIKERQLAALKTKGIPQTIAGEGLVIQTRISVKTMALYEHARTVNAAMGKPDLSMGDFIDVCVEDFYLGRGLDLGLIHIGGDNHA